MISNSETIVKDIILYDVNKKYTQSIRNIMQSLYINESVFSMSMTGTINVIDADNLYERDDLYDTELSVQITIAYAGNNKLKCLDFYVDSITDYKNNGDNTVSYTINLVSIEAYSNKLSRISKGYCGDRKSIVGDIMKYLSNKHYICEEMKGECKLLCPYMHPFDCINLLLVYGDDISDCLFWENFRGFNLRRITSMLKTDPVHHIYDSNATITNDKLDVTNTERETDKNNIIDYQVNSLVNSRLYYLNEGISNGIVQTYDSITGLPNKYQYGTESDSVCKTYFYNDNSLNYKSYIQRHDILNKFKNNGYNVTLRGDINRSTGDSIYVEMTNNVLNRQYNNKLSGNFVITSITHEFMAVGYTQYMTISK